MIQIFLILLVIPTGRMVYSIKASIFGLPKIKFGELVVEVRDEGDRIHFSAIARAVDTIKVITGHKAIWYISTLKRDGNEIICLRLWKGELKTNKNYQWKYEFSEEERKVDWSAFGFMLISDGRLEGEVEWEGNKLYTRRNKVGGWEVIEVFPIKLSRPTAFEKIIFYMVDSIPQRIVATKILKVAEIEFEKL